MMKTMSSTRSTTQALWGSLLLALSALLMTSSPTTALPTGAANCVGGRAAVGVTHLMGEVTQGSLGDGRLVFKMNGKEVIDKKELTGRKQIIKIPRGKDVEWTLEANKRLFRGFLVRVEDTQNGRNDYASNSGVDTTAALRPTDDPTQNKHMKVAETVCVSAFNVGGVTHTNKRLKQNVTGVFRMDEAVRNLNVDITVVIINRDGKNMFYYSGFLVHVVDNDAADDRDDVQQGGDTLVIDKPVTEDTTANTGNQNKPANNNNNNKPQNQQTVVEADDPTESEPVQDDGLPLTMRNKACSLTEKCGLCMGDCNNNNHCEGDLECFYRPGTEPVPGCSGLGVPGLDYCYAPDDSILRLRNNACSEAKPCNVCQGSCMHDSDCKNEISDTGDVIETACFLRPDSTSVPGCGGDGVSGRNYCFKLQKDVLRLTDKGCNSTSTCSECQGECFSSSDCEGNLECFIRKDLSPIPGCLEVGIKGRNYCYDPTSQESDKSDSATPDITITTTTPKPIGQPVPSPTRPAPRPTKAPLSTPSPTARPTKRVYSNTAETLTLTLNSQGCTSDTPCTNCVGDCNSNDDCAGVLQCFHRAGEESVPGCQGKGVAGRDYCAFNPMLFPPSEMGSTPVIPNNVGNNMNIGGGSPTENSNDLRLRESDCSRDAPCDECQGDCDSDSECGGILQCFFRRGTESVPGCNGSGAAGKDYCAMNPALLNGSGRKARKLRGTEGFN